MSFSRFSDRFKKNWRLETCQLTPKQSEYAIKTTFQKKLCGRKFQNIGKSSGKPAIWVSPAFLGTKEKYFYFKLVKA